jgi:phosphoribosyl 1,2-cyclic phosphodiesterase
MRLEVTILGSGSSGGVPRADGDWGVCDPADPRNRRSRCSMMIRRMSGEGPERWTTVVVDASPEFRLQTAEAGARLWIVDALRYTPHPTHAHVARTLEWIERLRPTRAILTNLHIELDYAELSSRLPAGVEPAFDGMRIEFDLEDEIT